MLQWVRDQIQSCSLPKGDSLRLELALEEALVNIINHTPSQKPFQVIIGYAHHLNKEIIFEVKDPGPAFNPLKMLKQDQTHLPIESIEPGGKGLILMRKCTDALLYRREGDYNILTLIKNLTNDD